MRVAWSARYEDVDFLVR